MGCALCIQQQQESPSQCALCDINCMELSMQIRQSNADKEPRRAKLLSTSVCNKRKKKTEWGRWQLSSKVHGRTFTRGGFFFFFFFFGRCFLCRLCMLSYQSYTTHTNTHIQHTANGNSRQRRSEHKAKVFYFARFSLHTSCARRRMHANNASVS